MEDFESFIYEHVESQSRGTSQEEGDWLCEMFDQVSMQEEVENTSRLIEEKTCELAPIFEVEIDEHVWMQILLP